MKKQINETDLPFDDLRRVGLYSNGKLNLEKANVDALLAGRRTDLISLKNLKTEGFRIEALDAKLSLFKSEDGKVSLNVHPIYKEARKHALLTDHEAEQLKLGENSVIRKYQNTPEGTRKVHVIEYDAETREFISYNPHAVLAPDKVNGESLSRRQKEGFRNGEIIELSDGTKFQHRASEPQGLRSDTSSLIISLLLDGGISYLMLKGLRSLSGREESQKEKISEGYKQAYAEMEKSNLIASDLSEQKDSNSKLQHSRGYGHGTSR